MSDGEKDGIMSCLHPREDMKLRNLRFARGSDHVIGQAEFRTQICRIAEQRRDGTATASGWTKARGEKVDAHTFISNI